MVIPNMEHDFDIEGGDKINSVAENYVWLMLN